MTGGPTDAEIEEALECLALAGTYCGCYEVIAAAYRSQRLELERARNTLKKIAEGCDEPTLRSCCEWPHDMAKAALARGEEK